MHQPPPCWYKRNAIDAPHACIWPLELSKVRPLICCHCCLENKHITLVIDKSAHFYSVHTTFLSTSYSFKWSLPSTTYSLDRNCASCCRKCVTSPLSMAGLFNSELSVWVLNRTSLISAFSPCKSVTSLPFPIKHVSVVATITKQMKSFIVQMS